MTRPMGGARSFFSENSRVGSGRFRIFKGRVGSPLKTQPDPTRPARYGREQKLYKSTQRLAHVLRTGCWGVDEQAGAARIARTRNGVMLPVLDWRMLIQCLPLCSAG